MPCLNRVRYVNFRYGKNGSMVLRDKTFDLAGESTLFNLVNSGGKTSLIHMMAQAVIPNASFDQRKVGLYFEGEPHTTHVLIEWLLDGSSGYLLTGFCGKGGHGELQRWLAYQHHYYQNNPFSLERIPVIMDDQVSLYDKFSVSLRQARQNGTSLTVYYDDEKTRYMNDLLNYGIIAKEWEMHLRINMKETEGLKAYYAKWKSSKALMEHEIIPKIDEKVQAKYPLSDHRACLQKHYSQLRQEPRIRAEIADLQGMEPLILQWSDAAEYLERQEQAKQAADIDLARFRLGVNRQADSAATELKEVQEQENSLKERQRETEYQMKSLELRDLQTRIAAINHLMAEEETAIQTETVQQSALKTQLQEARAVDSLRSLEARELELAELQTEQSNAAVGQEELQEKLLTAGGILTAYANATIERLDREIAARQGKITQLEEETAKAELAMVDNQKQFTETSSRIGVLEHQIGEFAAGVYKEAEEALSPFEFIDLETAPDAFVLKIDKQLKQQEKIRKEVNSRLNEAQSRQRTVDQLVNELDRKLQEQQHAQEKQTEICQRYEAAQADILSRLAGYVSDAGEIYSGMAHAKLTERQRYYDTQYIEHEESLRGLLAEQKKLSGDFYVATEQIITLVEELHRAGVAEAIAGSAYLLNQPDPDALLTWHPELPYSAVVNRASVEKLRQRHTAWQITVPILLLVRESLGSDASVKAESFVIGLSQDLYAVRPDDFRYYLSREEYNKFKTKVQDEIELRERDKKTCREQQQIIAGLTDAAAQYLVKFPQDAYATAQAEVRRLRAEMSGIRDRISTLRAESGQIIATINELTDRAVQAEEDGAKTAALKRLAERFAQGNRLNLENKEHLAECRQQITAIQSRLDDGKQRMESLRRQHRETERIIDNTERLKEEPEKIRDTVRGYSQPADCDVATVDPNRLLGEYQGLKKLFEAGVETAGSLEREIRAAARERHKAEQAFKAWGVSRERCGQLYQQPAYIKDQWEKAISDLETSIIKHGKEQSRLSGTLEEPVKNAEKLLQQIRKIFGREPQTVFADETTLAALEQSLNRIKAAIEEIGRKVETGRKRCDVLHSIKNSLQDQHLPSVEDALPFAIGDALFLSNKLTKASSDAAVDVVEARGAVSQAVHRLSQYQRLSDSKPIEDLVRKFGGDDAALFSGEIARKKAQEISLIIQDQVRALELQKARIDDEQDEIIDGLFKWAEFAGDEIHEMASCSRIKLQDSRRALVEIRKIDKPSEEQMRERLAFFVAEIIDNLNRVYQEGEDEAKLAAAIENQLSAYTILDKAINVSAAEVMVWLAEINSGASRMVRWEEGQSGGQGLVTAFVMYITLMAYTGKEHGKIHHTKTLFADNPFGEANAEHLLAVLFEILRENRIQLMAYTGLEDKNIYRRFGRVYLLRPVESANKRYTVLYTEQIKAGSGPVELQEAIVRQAEAMNYSLFDKE